MAGTLERRWNEALVELKTAQEELHQLRQQQGLELTEEQKAQMRALAEDLPKLWKSPTTSAQDRKRMLRLLINDITVEKRRVERKVVLHIRWQGGAVEDLSADIPLAAPDKVRSPEALVNRIRSLAAAMTDVQIAATLNQEGLLSAKGQRFTPSIVKWMRYRYEIPTPSLKGFASLLPSFLRFWLPVRTALICWSLHRLGGLRLAAGYDEPIRLPNRQEAFLVVAPPFLLGPRS